MTDDRLAQARAEAERRYGKRRKLTGRRIAHDAFLFGAAWAYEWADANPAPRTITVDDVGLAYVAFMEAEGHPVSRLVAALGALGIEVEEER